MDLQQFIRQFQWESDGFVDSYHILKLGEKGDCDDFASTVSYIESNGKLKMLWNIFVGRHKFYLCRTPSGGRHLILWVKSKGWIDNIRPFWSDTSGNYTDLVYVWVLPFFKLLIGKIDKT